MYIYDQRPNNEVTLNISYSFQSLNKDHFQSRILNNCVNVLIENLQSGRLSILFILPTSILNVNQRALIQRNIFKMCFSPKLIDISEIFRNPTFTPSRFFSPFVGNITIVVNVYNDTVQLNFFFRHKYYITIRHAIV